MRAKLITLFLLTFTCLLLALIWRLDQVFYQDKLDSGEVHSRAQLSALVKAFESELHRAEENLLLGFPQVAQVGSEYSADFPYGMFHLMGEMKFDGTTWKPGSIFFRQGSEAKKWGLQYAQLALDKIKPEKIPAGSTHLMAIVDPKGVPHFLMLANRQVVNPKNPEQKNHAWFLGLLSTNFLQSVLDRQKGQMAEIFLTNVQGQTLGHTEPQYIGKLLTEHPIVKEIQQNSSASGSGLFANLEGRRVQGFYEQIPASNLYVVISSPLAPIQAQRDDLRLQILLLGLGLAFLGVGVFVVVYKPEKEVVRVVAPELSKKVSSASLPAVVATANSPKAPESTEDRLKVYRTVASSLSHELWAPLTTILGTSAAMKNALAGSDEYGKVEKIEEQTRLARDVVQKLLAFSGEDTSKNKNEKFDEIIVRALKRVDGKILGKGIKLKKDFSTLTNLVPESLMRALEALLSNSIEAMDRVSSKELSVRGTIEGEKAILEIKDTGEGIDAAHLQKVFDPFYTSRGHGHHLGLGLSLALGLVREAHGEIDIESERGKGTTVKITLPMVSDVKPVETKAVLESSKKPLKAPIAEIKPAPIAEIKKAPAAPALLIDDVFEKMLDGEEPEEISAKKVDAIESMDLPPPPASEFAESTSPLQSVSTEKGSKGSGFSSKIDKPKIEFKKKDSKLKNVEVSIRRPGEKS